MSGDLVDPRVTVYEGMAFLLVAVVEVRYCTNKFGRRRTVDMEGVHRGRYEGEKRTENGY